MRSIFQQEQVLDPGLQAGIAPQPMLRDVKRAKPGKKARWFGRGADIFQTQWSAVARHPYCSGKTGASKVKMLSLEAMGSIRLPAVEKAGRGASAGLEYGQVGTRPVAFEWESGIDIRLADKVLCGNGNTGTC